MPASTLPERHSREEPDLLPARSASAAIAAGLLLALAMAVVSGVALAVTVLGSDPTPDKERLFTIMALLLVTSLSAAAILVAGGRGDSPLADVLRAFRRGALVGLACAGSILLQLNAAFTPANLAFLFLVLLIVEMIFLARRQDTA